MNQTSRLSPYSGPTILSYGFRPFFLAGAIYAGVAMLIWIPFFLGEVSIPTAFSPTDWHVHEMLYGFLPAIITGFLLTAIPNWTGRAPLQGGYLGVLLVTWLAGRLAILLSAWIGSSPAALIDLLFLLLASAAVTREVVAARNWRNLTPVGILLVLFGGNASFHLGSAAGTTQLGTRIGIAASIALIMVIGGRVIPSFTRNWLARENPGRLPASFSRYDTVSLVTATIALGLWIVFPVWPGTAALMLVSGGVHTIRLIRWAGDRAFRDGLVAILHIGYLFVPLGFALLAGAILYPQQVPVSAGIHAWTVGAIGIMTLAIMTRATLGHTGKILRASGLTQSIYAAVITAVLARVWASFEPSAATVLLPIAGGAWMVAFWGFVLGYGSLLIRPKAASVGE